MSNDKESNHSSEAFSELEWVNLQNDVSSSGQVATETNQEKFARKMKSNPFVPIGCLVTAGVLMFGLRSFMKGDRVKSQKMMRFRVLAQGTTILAIMIPMFFAARK